MSLAGLLAVIILVTAVIIIIALPFLKRSQAQPAQQAAALKQQDRVIAYYERTLQNIRDLDEDYALGKISAEDHQRERELWVNRGVQALKLLDSLAANAEASTPPLPVTTDETSAQMDAEIEATIESQLTTKAQNSL